MAKTKFYSLSKIKKRNATYNVIFGERSNGKTYACLVECLKLYKKEGKQFAYVRRWQADIRGQRARSIFSGVVDNGEITKIFGDSYTGIYYFGGKYYLCSYDENGKAVYSDTDCIGYAFSLADNEHNKSNSFPRVGIIVFDEFLTKGLYLPDEFVTFMNTVSTIVRQRTDVKIYMLGNTVNKYCPYFQEMGLNHIKEMKPGTIDVYTYGDSELKVAVEYTATNATKKANNFYFAFNNPKLKMITGGAWELDIYPHCPIKYKPKNIIFTYLICFNGETYQADVIDKEPNYFTFIHIKTTPIKDTDKDLIYTADEFVPKLNYNRNILKPINAMQERIKWFFVTDRVFYQDNSVGDAIHNYLNICKRGL